MVFDYLEDRDECNAREFLSARFFQQIANRVCGQFMRKLLPFMVTNVGKDGTFPLENGRKNIRF